MAPTPTAALITEVVRSYRETQAHLLSGGFPTIQLEDDEIVRLNIAPDDGFERYLNRHFTRQPIDGDIIYHHRNYNLPWVFHMFSRGGGSFWVDGQESTYPGLATANDFMDEESEDEVMDDDPVESDDDLEAVMDDPMEAIAVPGPLFDEGMRFEHMKAWHGECAVCFMPQSDVWADGPCNWGWPTRCSHWLCSKCWQGLRDHGGTRCPQCREDVSHWLNSHYKDQAERERIADEEDRRRYTHIYTTFEEIATVPDDVDEAREHMVRLGITTLAVNTLINIQLGEPRDYRIIRNATYLGFTAAGIAYTLEGVVHDRGFHIAFVWRGIESVTILNQ